MMRSEAISDKKGIASMDELGLFTRALGVSNPWQVDPAQIQVVCCDMWDPYLNGIGKFLKNALVVFDQFHVMSQINLALETVRRREQRENIVLKKSQFLWLTNPKNLTEKQEFRLASLASLNLKTARAYQIKLALARFWEIRDPAEAIAYLKRWYNWATHSRLDPIIRAARTIKRYWHGIINSLIIQLSVQIDLIING